MNQVLSPEEVAALLQGLMAGDHEPPAGPSVSAEMAGDAPEPAFCELKQVFGLKRISAWLAGLTELRWPQL